MSADADAEHIAVTTATPAESRQTITEIRTQVTTDSDGVTKTITIERITAPDGSVTENRREDVSKTDGQKPNAIGSRSDIANGGHQKSLWQRFLGLFTRRASDTAGETHSAAGHSKSKGANGITAYAKPAGPQSLDKFRKEALKSHNAYRAKHGVKSLTLSGTLNSYAQEWAEAIAKEGVFRHRPDTKYGENIFFAMKSSGETTATEVVDTWYAEIKDYDFQSHSSTATTGHFTQVVWKASKELGIGRVIAAGGKIYVVANYNPPGNIIGDFAGNVLAAKT